MTTPLDALIDAMGTGAWAGRPNALSPSHVAWEEIDTVAAATRKPRTPRGDVVTLAPPEHTDHRASPRAVDLIRQRRSAVDMYHSSMSRMPLGSFRNGAGTKAISPKAASFLARL